MNRKIGIVGENSIEYVKALLAVWRAGNCAVLLDWRLPAGQILDMLVLCGAEECYMDMRLKQDQFQGSSLKIHWMNVQNSSANVLSLKLYEDFFLPQSEEDALILFSSGTTGKSKGIVLSYRSIVLNSTAVAEYLQLEQNDCFYISKALSHSSTLVGELLVALRYRVRVILAPTIVPPRVALRTICEEQATILCVNPILLRLFAKTQERLQWDLPLRVIYTSGAVADRQLMLDARKVFGKIPVLDIYGLSEAGPRVSAQRIGSSDTPGSVGIPVQGVEVQVRSQQGGLCKPLEQGMIFVKTPSAMTRYLNNPSPCQAGWIYTGDIGYLHKDGELFVLGRADDIIVQGAHNLDPNGIETILKCCPEVEDCMVFGVEDSQYGHKAVCFYVATRDLEEELYLFARQKLADYEIPKEFQRVGQIPVTVTGKRSRALARAKYCG